MSKVLRALTKNTLVGLLLASVVMLGIPLGAAIAQEEVVKIGIVSPITGNYADHGMMERMGMQMAVEEFNAKGGVLGKKVKMRIEDSETDPAVASRKLRRLAEEGINFAMGGVSSSVAVAMGEVAKRYGVLLIATNQNSDTVTGKYANRCLFRVPPNMAMALRALGPYIVKNVGKKWYFFTHDYEWGWSGTRWARKVLEKYGGTEVGESKVPLGTRDFSSYILKARAANPDAVIITVGGLDRAALIEQIHEFGLSKETTIVHTLYDYEDAWAAGPEANVGVHGVEWYYDINAPGVKEFVERYQERFPAAPIPVPTQDTVNGYIAMRELLEAMKRAGTTEKVAPVIKALEGHTIPEGKSLRNGPTYIREWDHQFVCSYYIVRSKKPGAMRNRADLCEIVGYKFGEEIARTKEENPVELGPYPGE